ncbi:MAG TPA: 4Fe-4S dicluster domain-containing protein, partial [Rhodothermales bacterium]|nr:4Fe-4S dicluster domain-containing protein [Rhodothermales bacterium]
FLQLMGASIAMAGMTACRKPAEEILPYSHRPEEIIPGIPLFYATAMPLRGVLRPLLVETHEGRPTKVEGNPEHPMAHGRTSAFEQASVLSLYDPDRSQVVLNKGQESSLADFTAFARQLGAATATKRVVLLAEETSSPTFRAAVDRLKQTYPQLETVVYNAEGDDPVYTGAQASFGRPLRPFYQFSRKSVVLSLDGDFLNPVEPNFVHNNLTFADSRDVMTPQDEMSRLYVVESAYSSTGAKADHRLRLRSADVPFFAAAVAEEMGVAAGGLGQQYADHPFVKAAADDLRQAGPDAIVIAGDAQPEWVHALAMAMNAALGSIGRSVTLLDTGEQQRQPQLPQLRQLAGAMVAGQVDVLIVAGANPVYTAPGDVNFAEAMQRVPVTIHQGLHIDETAQVAQWHVPASHYLEQWGDGRAYDGTLSTIQPMIAPLYADAISEIELVNLLATGTHTSGYDLVRQNWQEQGFINGDFEKGWAQAIHDGFVPNTQFSTTSGAAAFTAARVPTVAADQVEVVFRLDPTLLDGRFANNAWQQELPDPTTKVVWDNVAAMSPKTAEQLGLEVFYHNGKYYSDVVELAANDRTIRLPIWIVPGHADNSITVNFGYGRNIKSFRPERKGWFFDRDTHTDVYAHGPLANGVGENVYPLRPSTANRVLVGVNVRKVDSGFLVATTQDHGTMEGRPIIRAASLEEFRKAPDFVEEAVEPLPGAEPWDEYPALWQARHPMADPSFKGNLYFQHQWGMSIDLNRCTGCNACVIACMSENNIPVVGKDEVTRGRKMMWLRIDRYYMGDEENLDEAGMEFQPMFCVQCENAPCEPVCPVYATSHSPDGISEMTYNRCIGTRYCSNNCPYKVRRFNFYNWTKTMPTTVQMAMNPHVTVRFRGVMEKCSYCVQRIRGAERRTIIEQRPLQDGEILTACQQVCPTDAIVFGDINDPNSKVSREKAVARNYAVLEELDTKPRTTHQGVVKNLNPRLVSA